MSQLIQMRRRITTIETLRKITNAMRLIAMSGHARLKRKEEFVSNYIQEVQNLYQHIKSEIPETYDPLASHINPESKDLIIIIGSQKSLCGSFNTHLFRLIENTIANTRQPQIIAIGKRAVDFIKDKNYGTLIDEMNKFSIANLQSIVAAIVADIKKNQTTFNRVIIYSNVQKTFFTQQPTITQLLPLEEDALRESKATIPQEPFQDYVWEQSAPSIINDLAWLYLEAKLHSILFQSLLAEQASRFLSMDSSTRNAEGLLDLYKLQYNKLRQAKITKEINELIISI